MYLQHSHGHTIFIRTFHVTQQVLISIGEVTFAAFLNHYYGLSSPCHGMWHYLCFQMPFLLCDNQPPEAFYRQVKGLARLHIPPRIHMNQSMGEFLHEELPELLQYNSLYNSGCTFNASGRMQNMNPTCLTLAMAALLRANIDICALPNGKYLVNGLDYTGQTWTNDHKWIYFAITGFDVLEGPQLDQYSLVDLFKHRTVNNGNTFQGVAKGAIEFVEGVCHIKTLPLGYPSANELCLYCLCYAHEITGDCPGK